MFEEDVAKRLDVLGSFDYDLYPPIDKVTKTLLIASEFELGPFEIENEDAFYKGQFINGKKQGRG